MTVKLTRPVNWAAWQACGTIVPPPRMTRQKPRSWPAIFVSLLSLAGLVAWAKWLAT